MLIFLLACAPTVLDSSGDSDSSETELDEIEPDDAEIVSAAFPSSIDCGGTEDATVVVRNTGSATWTSDSYRLGGIDDADPFADARVYLADGETVAPGAERAFTIAMVAGHDAGEFTTDWQMVHEGVRWFGDSTSHVVRVACAPSPAARTGPVALNGSSLRDDGGDFHAVGATMMWAAWAYKNDRPKLERDLQALSENGFDYIRALGVVGDYENADYWDGREIDWHWSDYADVIAGLTDLAYDSYGLRVEWTLIGDGQINIPDEADRYALVDSFLEMSRGREPKVMHFEIANEAWQNGFEGDEGLAQLRALTRYMQDRTDILVAASAPAGHSCDDIERVYGGGVGDIATIHFDRDTSTAEGPWRPVRQPWDIDFCDDVPVASNNEPIGPGSSVASEDDPRRLATAAIASYVAHVPLYVYHTREGVRGDDDLGGTVGIGAFRHLKDLVPGDLASWERHDALSSAAPFRVYAEDRNGTSYVDTLWPDLGDPAAGADRVYSGVQGQNFFTLAFGILDHVVLQPRRALDVTAYDPLTGSELGAWSLAADERFTLDGSAAVVLKGHYR